jgi:hypothetical protein
VIKPGKENGIGAVCTITAAYFYTSLAMVARLIDWLILSFIAE